MSLFCSGLMWKFCGRVPEITIADSLGDLSVDIHNFRYWCCHLYSSSGSVMQR
jgi:hypothetical protein